MKIEKASELLMRNYEKALRLSWVNAPVAWALYQTWKEADSAPVVNDP